MELPQALRFALVPVHARHDDWSADHQRHIILKLSRAHLVDEACRDLGHSRQSAYALRHHKDGRSYATAWHECDRLEEDWNLSKLTG